MNDPQIRYRTILFVEGDDKDKFLFANAIRNIDDTIKYYLLENALETFHRLELAAVVPELIFLHISATVQNGFEFLSKLKRSLVLKHIPVVVLTTSSAQDHLQKAYRLGARGFIVKPVEFDALCLELKTVLHCDFAIPPPESKADSAAIIGL